MRNQLNNRRQGATLEVFETGRGNHYRSRDTEVMLTLDAPAEARQIR